MRLIDVDELKLKFEEKCWAECCVCPYYEPNEKDIYQCTLIDSVPVINEQTKTNEHYHR